SRLTPAQLELVITQRPEALVPPQPDTLAALAARLAAPSAIGSTLFGLSRPQAQVIEALAALGDGCRGADLAALFGLSSDDGDLAGILASLADRALAWPDGSRIRTTWLARAWPQPLRLGRPLRAMLEHRRLEEMRRLAGELGTAPHGSKDVILGQIAERLTDQENVRLLVASAPKATRDLLLKTAWDGPFLSDHGFAYGGRTSGPAAWAVDRGLLGSDGTWGAQLEMPAEVALALRGPDYRLRLDASAPLSPTVAISVEAVEHEAAAVAGTALARLSALFEECAKAPLALLKMGGVGVRELRRLGKVLGDDEDRVRLWLELADCAGLVAQTEAGLLLTEDYDEWCQEEPAEQFARILECWRGMPAMPLLPPGPDAPKPPALDELVASPMIEVLRTAVIGAVAALPADSALPDVGAVAELVAWRHPLIAGSYDDPAGLVASIWREAELLGLIAHHAATSLARALAEGDPTDGSTDGSTALAAAARDLMPAAQNTVLIQADLTAVVTGTPSGSLAALLDMVADRESRSGAWIWRFSPASVYRALDAGLSNEEILGSLCRVAVGGKLPQPLAYLIADAGRRHGVVRVRPVACVLRCVDPGLLTEILHAKSLRKLNLARLAPTVLASAAPVAETLKALRAAGYAPTGENSDGTSALERLPRQRAAAVSDDMWPDGGSAAIPPHLVAELMDQLEGLPDDFLMSVASMHAGELTALSNPTELAHKLLHGRPAGPTAHARPGVRRSDRRRPHRH
ncbi:MAG: hypothetical protein QOE61_2493, partial [Micromonosporaceae bacterium]|nr:hypothetical protein [Micromonosporaceae bacterium]